MNERRHETLFRIESSWRIHCGGDKSLSECAGTRDTLTPVVGWWMFIKKGSPRGGVQGDNTPPPEIPVDKDFDLEAGLKGPGGEKDSKDGIAGVTTVADLAKSKLSTTFEKIQTLFGCLQRNKK